ncbi:MAG: AbrB/MazE/SpoVT family DNA-binding domain-containing protein [Acidobacteria bacterium]|nr:AbrB/MazE/SpoVT family DNA-binding domain-containing protein [Acidobacteriota bacterium]
MADYLEATATTKGQVVIPAAIRRKLGIESGTRIQVKVDEKNAQIILKPITREYIHSMRGRYRGSGLLDELNASRARDREREEKKIRRK